MLSDRRERPLLTSAEVKAFENIFTRYYPLVYRLAYRYVGQPDDAEYWHISNFNQVSPLTVA
jgi:hypothetical protein